LSKQKPRECQPCTACCDGWLQIVVEGQPVYPGKPCHHSTGSGSPLPEWMKPSNAKVVVLFNQTQWRGMPVDVAVPVGRRIPPRALNWLQQFAETQQRALLYSEQIVENGKFSNRQSANVYGPPEFQQEMAQRMQNGQPLW
jgi:hypothetical protein